MKNWKSIMEKLDEFARMTDDEEGIVPTDACVAETRGVISHLARLDREPAGRICPNGENGMVLEWFRGDHYRHVEITSEAMVEIACFEKCRIYLRQEFPPGKWQL